MAIQAVIMAGGEGARLRPLTQLCPKPLAPLCGEEVMGYALRLLQRHGIYRARATLCYRPRDVIRAFGAGRHGVQLDYCTESSPLGTAGSVKAAVGEHKDTTLVLSGDGLTGCDLTCVLKFHQNSGAMATMVLKKVADPRKYGVVSMQSDGRITRFVEKPEGIPNGEYLVNTGVYLLEAEALALIPTDCAFDFGRQLFPMMVQLGLPLYGCESREYWCDVGDLAAFLRAQGDLLGGRTGFTPADVGIRALKNGFISNDSYVSPLSSIAPDAVIENSCILPGVRVGSGVRIHGSIICPGAAIGRGATLAAGSMLGAGARVGAFVRYDGKRMESTTHAVHCAGKKGSGTHLPPA